MIKKIMDFFKDEEGASMVEYGLLVSLIAVASIVALTALGGNLSALFTSVGKQVGPTP
jgi:pilus assembly protein Flp/PilA